MKQPYSITSYQLVCSVLLLLGSWLGLATSSQAQVFYLTTDGNGSATTATDALNRMEYDGTNATVLAPAVTASPFLLAVDVPTNRAFVYESIVANRAIKVINLTTGALIRSIGGIQAGIRALRYDPVSDYLYYLTSADVPTTVEPTDALNRVRPDGTGAEVLLASLSTSPLYLALNTAANEVYFYEGLNTARAIKTVNLASRTVTQTTPVSAQVQAIEYDVATGFLYYLTSDNSLATTASIDALHRFRPDGTNPSVIASAITASPFLLALDATANRAFVYESSATNRAIKTVNLLTGNVTQTVPVTAQVTGLSVPVASAFVAPTVITNAANNVSSTAATLGGNVTADGGASVTERGVVYSSTATAPTISNTKVTIGSGAGSFAQTVSGLMSGTTYYVRAYASNSVGTGYGAVQSFTTAAALTASPSAQTNLACNGDGTGAATVRVSGGTAPYSYSWRNNTTSSALPQTTASVTGLTAGSYTVTVTDASGATATSTFTLTQPSALATTGSQVNVSTTGGTDGTATVNVSGGTAPYSYSWRNNTTSSALPQTTTSVTGLTAGTYAVTVTDANGCTTSRAYTITQPAATVTATSLVRAAASPTNATSVAFTLTFSGNVSGLSFSNFSITTSGLTGVSLTSVSGSGTTYTVRVNTGSGDGTLRLNLANATGLSPTVTNVPFAGETYILDKTAPAAPVVTALANGSLLATNTPTYSGTAEAGSTVTVTVDGTPLAVTVPATSSGSWQLTAPAALADGTHTLVTRTTDASGNTSVNSATNTFTIDTSAPTVAITSTAGSSGGSTATSPLPFTVTFSESVTGFTTSGVSVTGGTLGGFSGSGTTYTFSVTPPTTGGEVTVTVAANGAQDAAGNGNLAATPFSLRYVLPVTVTTWTGDVSTDWFTAGNWTAGVPTRTLDARIPTVSSGRYPLIASGAATARALTLNSNAQLAQRDGTLTLTGDLTNNGAFTLTGGTVVLGPAGGRGTNLFGSSTSRFWNLTVDATGVQLLTSAGASVQRVLTLEGDLTTNGNPFTLLSTPTATALVVNNAGRVVGTATVQRAIDGSLNPGAGYRHYSSPVASTTVADIATGGFSPVVNPDYNTVGTTVQPFPTVYGYDEARLTGNSAPTQAFEYGYFSPSSLSDPLVRGRGYTVNLSASNTVDLVGTLNTGSIPVGALSRSSEANAGWHLLGNPYPAPLDWSKARLSLPAGVIDAVYVYKSSDQYRGTYQFYQNGFGTLPDGLIGSMQGFFVRVSQPVAAFTFLDTWRSTTDQATIFNRPAAEKRTAVQLDLVSATGVHEPTFVYFEAGATTDLDDHYDAAKLPNTTGLNLSSLASEASLAVNGLPLLTTPTTVPLAVGVPLTGTYTLHAAALQNVEATDVYLHDAVTGQQVNLKQHPSYTFTASHAALLTDRFALRFSPLRPLATQMGSRTASLSVYPNPARQQFTLHVPAMPGATTATATLYNLLGQPVRETSLPLSAAGGRTTVDVHELPTGVYVLRVQVDGTTLTKQLLID